MKNSVLGRGRKWSAELLVFKKYDAPMFSDIATIIGLIFVGFVLGLLFLERSYDCAAWHQKATIPKATGTMHQNRHTPYAVP